MWLFFFSCGGVEGEKGETEKEGKREGIVEEQIILLLSNNFKTKYVI